MKNSDCNNSEGPTEREIQITRIELIKYYEKDSQESWLSLDTNPNYLISSNGRLKHLKSYQGKARVLCPSIKFGKYLYYTITNNGKRQGISLNEIFKRHFSGNS